MTSTINLFSTFLPRIAHVDATVTRRLLFELLQGRKRIPFLEIFLFGHTCSCLSNDQDVAFLVVQAFIETTNTLEY